MKARTAVLVLLGATVLASSESAPVSAQQPSPSAPPVSVIQIGLDLVRIDAAVVDHAGRPVTDLRPEDFTIEVDGRKQPVTNAAYIGAKPGSIDGTRAATAKGPEPASSLDTVVFVVDDLNMAFGSMFAARQALAKFATTWTPAGSSVGMRLTSDESMSVAMLRSPEELLLAARTLRYFIRSGQPLSSVEGVPSNSAAPLATRAQALAAAPETAAVLSGADPTFVRQNRQQRVSNLVSTIDALRSLPGRKAVVFLSEGFLSEAFFSTSQRDEVRFPSPFNTLFDDTDIRATLRMITEVANRASVVVYAIDPRGLTLDFAGAESYVTPEEAAELRRSRSQARVESQGSLRQLAADTGGIAVVNSGIPQGLDKVVRDHSAYYLIGFEPAQTTFAKVSGRPKFHKIKLAVNRKGVHVRTRAGFYGVTDEEVTNRAPMMTSPDF